MRAKEISLALGGNGIARQGGRYWCSCPIHGDKTPSLTVKDDPARRDGIDVKCWSAGCDPLAIKADLIRRGYLPGLGDDEAPKRDPKALARRADEARREQNKRRDLARWLWSRAEPGKNSRELARYLGERRSIDLERIGGVPDCLRHEVDALIPETEPKRYGPAMIAAVTNVMGGLTAVHETFLNFSGSDKARLADSKFIKGPPSGGAVRLFPIPNDGSLGTAEGIETALSAAELHGIPTWAVLNTSCMSSFMVPPRIKRLVIFADFDKPSAVTGKRPGTVAAESLLARATSQGIACEIRYPSDGFKDFNDELVARKRLGAGNASL